ncbi:MAG: hypothetical protein ACREJN_12495 [Nitrospiraceae bacterium]
MKTIVLKLDDALKAKLDDQRAKGYTLNGLITALLQREFASADRDRLNPRHLNAAQIAKIEDAMNTDDLEVMCAGG